MRWAVEKVQQVLIFIINVAEVQESSLEERIQDLGILHNKEQNEKFSDLDFEMETISAGDIIHFSTGQWGADRKGTE